MVSYLEYFITCSSENKFENANNWIGCARIEMAMILQLHFMKLIGVRPIFIPEKR